MRSHSTTLSRFPGHSPSHLMSLSILTSGKEQVTFTSLDLILLIRSLSSIEEISLKGPTSEFTVTKLEEWVQLFEVGNGPCLAFRVIFLVICHCIKDIVACSQKFGFDQVDGHRIYILKIFFRNKSNIFFADCKLHIDSQVAVWDVSRCPHFILIILKHPEYSFLI